MHVTKRSEWRFRISGGGTRSTLILRCFSRCREEGYFQGLSFSTQIVLQRSWLPSSRARTVVTYHSLSLRERVQRKPGLGSCTSNCKCRCPKAGHLQMHPSLAGDRLVLSVLKRGVPKMLAFAFGLRLRSEAHVSGIRVRLTGRNWGDRPRTQINIFAETCRFSQIHPFSRKFKHFEGAGNRRKPPKIFAENRRLGSVTRSVTLSSAL